MGNQYWPADYLVDAQGNIRDAHFGEGDYSETERAIRTLLAEAGHTSLGSGARATAQAPSAGDITPETYLGALRAQGWVTPVHPGDQDFGAPPGSLPPISSPIRATGESATRTRPRVPERRSTWSSTRAASSWCSARRAARHIQVLLDGKPIPAKLAGADVRRGAATIRAQRLYRLVDLPAVSQHRLTLRFDPGITGYAFTFG